MAISFGPMIPATASMKCLRFALQSALEIAALVDKENYEHEAEDRYRPCAAIESCRFKSAKGSSDLGILQIQLYAAVNVPRNESSWNVCIASNLPCVYRLRCTVVAQPKYFRPVPAIISKPDPVETCWRPLSVRWRQLYRRSRRKRVVPRHTACDTVGRWCSVPISKVCDRPLYLMPVTRE